jgi:hypothetical protein
MNETPRETEARQQVEVINSGEELLLKARATARKIEERVWHAMEGHAPATPHRRLPPEE